MSYQIEVVERNILENSEYEVRAFYELYDFDGDEGAGLCLHDEPSSFSILCSGSNIANFLLDTNPEYYYEIKKDCLEKAKDQATESFKDTVIYLP